MAKEITTQEVESMKKFSSLLEKRAALHRLNANKLSDMGDPLNQAAILRIRAAECLDIADKYRKLAAEVSSHVHQRALFEDGK